MYDDPARESLNRTKLVFSRYTEDSWSTPQAVDEDKTADFHPQAAFLPDGRVLTVWENLKEELPDDATLEKMQAKMEIAYAVYDPQTGNWQKGSLTDDNFFNHSPQLAVAEDGTALLTWTENKTNSLFGTPEKPDNLAYSIWDKNNWSAAREIAVVSNPVIKSALAYNGSKGLFVWESDEDNDLSTIEDRELRLLRWEKATGWRNEELLTANQKPDLAPQILFECDIPVLFWLKSDAIAMARNLELSQATVTIEDMQSPGGMSFKVLKKDNGLMLFWSDPSKEGADIYVTHWDRSSDRWGKPQKITADDSLERDINGCVLEQNAFFLIYNKVKYTYPEEGLPEPEKTDLYVLSYQEGVDLSLNYLSSSNPSPAPGDKLTLTAEVANPGETVEENILVLFYKGDPEKGGELIGSASLTGLLAPGEFGQVNINWQVPYERNLTLYAVIDPQFAPTDRNQENNKNQIEITIKGNFSSINGQARCEGRTDQSGIIITLEGTVAGTVYTITTASDGMFVFTGLEPGAYILTANYPGFLKAGRTVTAAVYEATEAGELLLLAGDISGDNLVDIDDLLLLRQTYDTIQGGIGFNPVADFNADGRISLIDLVLLARNYTKEGYKTL